MTVRSIFAGFFLLVTGAGWIYSADGGATTPAEADADFALQGEFVGNIRVDDDGKEVRFGVQIIALGEGMFRGVGYRGGLPGDGWDGTERNTSEARRDGNSIRAETESGGIAVVTAEHVTFLAKGAEIGRLQRVVRKSPTLGAAPPEGAVVLFDGKSTDQFPGAKMTDDGLLIAGATSGPKFGSCRVHLEFLLPYMPAARGQGRANSGCYLQGRYEVQILDSFGLDGLNNECGGIYTVRAPSVNMCLPPLAWQTYDIDFTAAKYDAQGTKMADAHLTVRHNGVLIHENVPVPEATRAAPVKDGPEHGPLYLQDHGNPVRFRNIWVVPRPE